MIEEAIAPLDAYVTAKPDEPTFTLQGGDPLAAPLIRVWVLAARARAGLGISDAAQTEFQRTFEAAFNHSVKHDERERDNLLLRATAAEEVSWAMDAYVKGQHNADVPSEADNTHLTELQRLDLHDLRVRIAQRLSNFRCELVEMRQALLAAGFREYTGDFASAENHLAEANSIVEPRRVMKKD